LFIVAYFYVGVTKNWSQKRRTNPKGRKLRPKAENKGELFEYKGRSPGRSLGSKRFLGLKNPIKMHILSINFISFTAQIYNALHMQGKNGDFGILGTMASLPP